MNEIQHNNQNQVARDPNETTWEEVKELGLEPEPAGMDPMDLEQA